MKTKYGISDAFYQSVQRVYLLESSKYLIIKQNAPTILQGACGVESSPVMFKYMGYMAVEGSLWFRDSPECKWQHIDKLFR